MQQQEHLVNCWRSATDRPNVLVIGSADAVYVISAMSLRNTDTPCEVVCLDKFSDAMRLLRRGSIAVVVVPESPATDGGLELILEGLGKTRPPRYVVAGSGPLRSADGPASLVRMCSNAPASVRDTIVMAVADYERNSGSNLSVRVLLEATAGFPEQLWLKVCNEDGEFSDLCLNAGRIVYAECGKLMGPEAAEKVLSWTNCLYESRELPAFLQSNMSCWLRELGRLHQPDIERAPVQEPEKKPEAQSIEESAIAEEPMEMATLGSEAEIEHISPVVAAPPAAETVESTLEEPTEMNFDPEASFDLHVDEPSEMRLSADEELPPIGDPEEPEIFEFDGSFSFDLTDAAPAPDSSRVFAAVAVIAEGSSHLENCEPPEEAMYFDNLAIRDMFDLSVRCGNRQQTGPYQWVLLCAESGGLVIASIPGGRRLVAARFRREFGDPERHELKRLQESLEHSCSLA